MPEKLQEPKYPPCCIARSAACKTLICSEREEGGSAWGTWTASLDCNWQNPAWQDAILSHLVLSLVSWQPGMLESYPKSLSHTTTFHHNDPISLLSSWHRQRGLRGQELQMESWAGNKKMRIQAPGRDRVEQLQRLIHGCDQVEGGWQAWRFRCITTHWPCVETGKNPLCLWTLRKMVLREHTYVQ
jgi:hypothetical protein